MLSRLVVSTAVACVIAPHPLFGQISLSSISIRDVDQAIRIGRVLLETHDAVSATRSRSSATRTGRRAVATGDEYVGVPYKWGGSTPRGFDCSGFVQYVYREHGVRLPRTSRQMAHAGRSVSARLANLRAGDLMLFRGKKGVISHVALYAGNNEILHSSSSGHGVRYDNLSSKRGKYYVSHFVRARRVTENGQSLVQALAEIYRKYPFDYFDPPDAAPRVK